MNRIVNEITAKVFLLWNFLLNSRSFLSFGLLFFILLIFFICMNAKRLIKFKVTHISKSLFQVKNIEYGSFCKLKPCQFFFKQFSEDFFSVHYWNDMHICLNIQELWIWHAEFSFESNWTRSDSFHSQVEQFDLDNYYYYYFWNFINQSTSKLFKTFRKIYILSASSFAIMTQQRIRNSEVYIDCHKLVNSNKWDSSTNQKEIWFLYSGFFILFFFIYFAMRFKLNFALTSCKI